MKPTFGKNDLDFMKAELERWDRGSIKALRRQLGRDLYRSFSDWRNEMGYRPVQALLHILHKNLKPVCQNPKCKQPTRYSNNFNSYQTFCSRECSNASESTKARYRETCLAKYGVDNASKASSIKMRKEATCKKNFGVSHPMQSKVVMAKSKATVRKRYGVHNVSAVPSVLSKKKATWMDKYGYDNPSKSPTIKKVIGRKVHASIAEREVVRVRGKQYILQGYEPQALKFIQRFFDNRHIHDQSSGRTPSFEYYFDGRNRTYFPDFLVDDGEYKCVVEVKSTYTLCYTEHKFRNAQAKAKAVLKKGYNYKMLLMQPDGTRMKIPSDWCNMRYKDFIASLPGRRRGVPPCRST